MTTRIHNREGALPPDHWYQIEVPGLHLNPAAKVVQVLDALALESIVNRFAAEAAAPDFAGLPVGRDHLGDRADQPTEALGWLREVRNREGLLEGRIEWTALGRPLIEGQVYKFFSTEYASADLERTAPVRLGNREWPAVRPRRLDGLEVTNRPNNRGGKPISNRAPSPDENPPNPPLPMQKLITLLGLPAEATEDQILAAVKALQTGAADLPPLKNRLLAAENELATLRQAQMAADLDARADKITNRAVAERLYAADRAGTLALLDGLTAPIAPARITNRASAQTPATLAAAEAAAAKADAEVQAYKINNRCSYEEAHSTVRRLKPELFA